MIMQQTDVSRGLELSKKSHKLNLNERREREKQRKASEAEVDNKQARMLEEKEVSYQK